MYVLSFPRCVNLRCTGHVTIKIKRGNDGPAQCTHFLAFARKKPRARTLFTAVDISLSAVFYDQSWRVE